MLVTQISAVIAAIPMAAALSVRGGPGGGWGHGGGHWGGHHDGDHEPEHELEKFRIVTYDLEYALTKEYYTLSPVDDGQYKLWQTEDKDDSGTFEVTEDGFLEWVTPDGEENLVASYDIADFGELAVPLAFSAPETAETEWKWIVDYHDYTLVLYHSASTTPYFLLVCTSEDPEARFLAVGVVGNTYADCVAVHLDIEDVDEKED
ncbi:hypothetical protein QBC37DRAFT_401380 [Rhypophila decipiens]|uniref:Uncharacterized protein n=1 Tax=Rhypophila decipiens TaxID=261697 RepID=A0AAN6Y5K9_9PEZI|nr:hypothetical protein QBC37DRAFT_401380 [Rhypophila decipiens]